MLDVRSVAGAGPSRAPWASARWGDRSRRTGGAPALPRGQHAALPVLFLLQFGHNPRVDRLIRERQVLLTGLREELPPATQVARHAEETAATHDLIRAHPSTARAWSELHHWCCGVYRIKHKGDGRDARQGVEAPQAEHRERDRVGPRF